MSGLQRAIERNRWDLVWWYLLVGAAEVASKLPPDSLHELIEMLASDDEQDAGGERRGS